MREPTVLKDMLANAQRMSEMAEGWKSAAGSAAAIERVNRMAASFAQTEETVRKLMAQHDSLEAVTRNARETLEAQQAIRETVEVSSRLFDDATRQARALEQLEAARREMQAVENSVKGASGYSKSIYSPYGSGYTPFGNGLDVLFANAIGNPLSHTSLPYSDPFRPWTPALGLREPQREAALDAFLARTSALKETVRQAQQLLDENNWPDEQPSESESELSEQTEAPEVIVRPFSESLLRALCLNPHELHQLTPGQFEGFIADRLDRMGFDPFPTGQVNRKDGGIDIIARPRSPFPFGLLVAVQCEHHRVDRKTNVRKVRDILSHKGGPFQVGLVVTNTDFTIDARHLARRPENSFVRLRDFADLVEWIRGNYSATLNANELPASVEVAQGHIIRLRD